MHLPLSLFSQHLSLARSIALSGSFWFTLWLSLACSLALSLVHSLGLRGFLLSLALSDSVWLEAPLLRYNTLFGSVGVYARDTSASKKY